MPKSLTHSQLPPRDLEPRDLMPKNKDLKRLVRSRMEKTGEAYTTARARLVEKRSARTAETGAPRSAGPAPAAAPDYAALAGMSDDAVRAKTGRDWKGWVEHLDGRDAARLPHREIARHLQREMELSAWWAQTVTVGYERIRGLRDIGQRRGGSYEAHKSKTLPVAVAELYRAFNRPQARERWLPDEGLEIRTATPEKSMRIAWGDGTSVDVRFTAKSEAKSQVAIQHQKLASKAEAERKKRFWAERLTALGELLAGGAAKDGRGG
jgi:hypothetical protein